MLYALLPISLILFCFGGYKLMSRLDRFLGWGKVNENKKDKRLSFEKYRPALRREKPIFPTAHMLFSFPGAKVPFQGK